MLQTTAVACIIRIHSPQFAFELGPARSVQHRSKKLHDPIAMNPGKAEGTSATDGPTQRLGL